jgi:ATP-dependent Zn protease
LGILPMLLLIGAWYFVMRQMQAGGRDSANRPD